MPKKRAASTGDSVLASVLNDPLTEDLGGTDGDEASDVDAIGMNDPLRMVEDPRRAAVAPGGFLDESGPELDPFDGARVFDMTAFPMQHSHPSDVAAQASMEVIRRGSDERDGDQRPAPARFDQLDPLTSALGARIWRSSYATDWARQRDGRRYRFTRYYFEQRVLVDIFKAASPAVVKEVAEKSAALAIYNAWLAATRDERNEGRFARLRALFMIPDVSMQPGASTAPIGYLPVIRGAMTSLGDIARALGGETLELIVDRQRAGVLA